MIISFKSTPPPPARILDFDMEARPLGWYGGDFTHKEITAIASAWVDDPEGSMDVLLLDKTKGSSERMLKGFLKRYNEADIVAGHYIRGFDLPLLNGAMMEFGLPPLSDKMSHDTKGDLVKRHGLSMSQQNLAAMLGIKSPKIGMTTADWREANRLTPKGLELTAERAAGDVIQNIEMRQRLIDLGLLTAPKLWSPAGSGHVPQYHA